MQPQAKRYLRSLWSLASVLCARKRKPLPSCRRVSGTGAVLSSLIFSSQNFWLLVFSHRARAPSSSISACLKPVPILAKKKRPDYRLGLQVCARSRSGYLTAVSLLACFRRVTHLEVLQLPRALEDSLCRSIEGVRGWGERSG